MIKPKALTSLSVFFPCYNEAENVGTLIRESVEMADRYGVDYEIVVVDDGSRDRTAEIVSEWREKNPRVRLVRHSENKGYGAAVRSGFENAAKDLVFMTDGDRQFRVAEIEKLFSKIDSCDVVTGYRIGRRDKGYRRLNGRLWTALTRFLFGLPVRDVDCAFKLVRRHAMENLKLESNQLLIHAEFLARLKKRGCKIEEIGVTHYPREKGKATATAPLRVLKTFAELFRLYWRLR
ncbi:MAG: glycosyltransferase family 2 protein [Candidatus Omnitrophica bacterium]|nr:glycosyltransferase family 2 protein [Candidatus Omnitrophota bacterium]